MINEALRTYESYIERIKSLYAALGENAEKNAEHLIALINLEINVSSIVLKLKEANNVDCCKSSNTDSLVGVPDSPEA